MVGCTGLPSSGPPPGPAQSAVLLSSALLLLSGAPANAAITPSAVANHGQGWGRYVDSPTAREMLAGPVNEVLQRVGPAVPLGELAEGSRLDLVSAQGSVLDLAYHRPQQLRNRAGVAEGSSRYIALWWRRAQGAPDLVLCGPQMGRVGAAFETEGLDAFDDFVDRVPHTGRGLVQAVEFEPLPALRSP